MRTARLAGHYMMALGTASVLAMAVLPLLGEPFRLDFSFILQFLIGWGLLDGRSLFRTIALVLSSIGVLACIGLMVYMAALTGRSRADSEFRSTPFDWAQAILLLILMLPPLVLLLLPESRRWFAEMSQGTPDRYTLTGRALCGYLAAACILIGVVLSLQGLPGAPGRTVTRSSLDK